MSSVKLDGEDRVLWQFLLENPHLMEEDALSFFPVCPQPGFCVKIKNDDNEKVFINICYSSQLKGPPDITESELLKILESDGSDFAIPMTLGEPHIELDKSGKARSVYDVLINDKFFDKIKNDKFFQNFLIDVVIEGLEEKYNIALNREWVILKNRKFVGIIQEQNIKKKSKPIITEMNDLSTRNSESKKNTANISVIDKTDNVLKNKPSFIEPECIIVKDSAEGQPQFLVAEIKLPNTNSSKEIEFDLGEDRIIVNAKPNYLLDIFLPYLISQQNSSAQFNIKNKILLLTLPVTA